MGIKQKQASESHKKEETRKDLKQTNERDIQQQTEITREEPIKRPEVDKRVATKIEPKTKVKSDDKEIKAEDQTKAKESQIHLPKEKLDFEKLETHDIPEVVINKQEEPKKQLLQSISTEEEQIKIKKEMTQRKEFGKADDTKKETYKLIPTTKQQKKPDEKIINDIELKQTPHRTTIKP